MTCTFWQLMFALKYGTSLGPIRLVSSVERESGDGQSFNVHGYLNDGGDRVTIFMRTED